jgi:hypothetical protein
MSDTTSKLPSKDCLTLAVKLAIKEDKPIMMDYWEDALNGTAVIGVRNEDGEKLLVKSKEEYTSPISNIYGGTKQEYIIATENSLYIVPSSIAKKRVS